MRDFPPVVDSSMLAAYKSCPRHFELGYVDNQQLQGESVHLHAGGAFAKGVEAGRRSYYVDGMSQQDSEAEGLLALVTAYGDFECPEGVAKTLDRMCGALEFYYENYPFDTDRARIAKLGPTYAVEFSFGIPIGVLHPVSGNPIIFAGRADGIVEYANGLYPIDEKTTSQLGASWSRQWELRGQFTGYAWALRKTGYTPTGSIVRGISILKTKYETQEAIVSQPPWKIDRWEASMIRTVGEMIADWRSGQFNYDLGESCNAYGGCSHKMLCQVEDPKPWLETYYETRVWHPLDRH